MMHQFSILKMLLVLQWKWRLLSIICLKQKSFGQNELDLSLNQLVEDKPADVADMNPDVISLTLSFKAHTSHDRGIQSKLGFTRKSII
jgi:hypothetical protein